MCCIGATGRGSDRVTPKKSAKVEDIEPLLIEHKGNVSAVARHLGYKSRGLLYRRINESPTLQAAVEDARETFVDEVESALFNEALAGNVTAQIFVLKAHPAAKRRGWGERTEISNATDDNGAPLPFRIVDYRAGLTETEE